MRIVLYMCFVNLKYENTYIKEFWKIKKNFLIKIGIFVVNCNFICYNEKNNCDKERICLIG